MRSVGDREPLEVVVVGGGVAGLEVLMALRTLAGSRVSVKLVSARPEFVYRPMSVAEPFDLGGATHYPLSDIAAEFGAELIVDGLARVDAEEQKVALEGGEQLSYDVLVLALGAVPVPVWDHVVTFAGSSDSESVRAVVADVESGEAQSVAFVVPTGMTWSLPPYELALMTARRATRAGHSPELTVYTPESDPLRIFGREASREVWDVLERAGVTLVRSVGAEVTPLGDLVIPFEETPLRFERVIALPRLEGPALEGVPHDPHGFMPIDSHGAVSGVENVYAAGDGTDFAVKHGGIATQQADAIAEVIAQRAGADVEPRPFHPTLRGRLLTGEEPHFLRGEVGEASKGASEASDAPLWWPAAKITGTYLAPYLETLGSD